MRVAGLGSVLVLGVNLWACAATQTAASNAVVAPAPLAALKVPPPPPLQVAPAPKDLFLVGRMNQPGATLDTLGEWANMPLPWQEILGGALPALQKFLVLDAPIEFAMTLEPDGSGMPDFFGVASIGLSEQAGALDSLRKSGQALDHISSDLDYFAIDESVQCAVARANGTARARLICGTERKALDVLASFAASNLPTQALSTKAAYIEFRAEPIRARYGKRANLIKASVPLLLREAALGNSRFDTAFADAAYALADEAVLWVDELDKLTWSSELSTGSQEVLGEFGLHFRKHRSYLASNLLRRVNEATVAPELFWSLPRDATSAGYTAPRTINAADRKVVDTLVELLGGALEYGGLASGPLTKWTDDFRAIAELGGAWVTASGSAPDGASKAEGPALAFGYYVLGTETGGAAYLQWLESTVAVLNDKKFRTELEARLGKEVRDFPQIRSRKLPSKDGVTVQLFEATVKVPPAAGESPKKGTTLTPIVAAASRAGRTWLVMAMDEKLALSTLTRVLDPNPSDTLGSRSDLSRMREAKVGYSSFFSLEGFTRFFGALGPAVDSPLSPAELERAMPNHGKTPMFIDVQSSSEGPSAKVRVAVPRGSLADGVALAISLMAQGTSQVKAPPVE